MNMDLYAQLHGIARAVHKGAVTEVDPEFEMDVDAYVESVLEEEKKTFQEGIESFEQYSKRMAHEIREAMHEFYKGYANGYKVICAALKAEGKEEPQISDEELKVFDDPENFIEAIESGMAIYELLGFSFGTLLTFYEVLNHLYENEEYEKVKDGFFFLITISPTTPEFWTALGYAYTKLQEFEKAEEAYFEALDLDPTSKDAYLGCFHVYVMMKRGDDAERLCEYGIELAKATNNEEFEKLLTEAKEVIKTECSST